MAGVYASWGDAQITYCAYVCHAALALRDPSESQLFG